MHLDAYLTEIILSSLGSISFVHSEPHVQDVTVFLFDLVDKIYRRNNTRLFLVG